MGPGAPVLFAEAHLAFDAAIATVGHGWPAGLIVLCLMAPVISLSWGGAARAASFREAPPHVDRAAERAAPYWRQTAALATRPSNRDNQI